MNPSTTRVRRTATKFTAAVALAALALVGLVAAPAYATDYPTWEDVKAAKGNVEKTNAEISRIKGIIAGLESEVVTAQAIAQKRGEEYQEAQDAFDAADRRAADLEQQAKDSEKAADEAMQQAGRLAAQLYRSGGNDLSVNLLFESDAENADQLLSKLGSMSKLVERSSIVYEQAQIAKNTAHSLQDQAEVARGEREKLRVAAQDKLQEAMAAQQAAEAALAEKEAKSIELDQQLLALQDTEAKTIAGYKAGVAERERIRKEKEKAAREKLERERIAAEKAAREAAARDAAGSGGSGGSGGGGQLGGQGWARPASGWISDGYGPRATICSPYGACSSDFHRGTDIAAYCGAGIYAAHSGTVIYAGPNGTYGNFVLIDHGDGISTGYAHIRYGGIGVGWGQHVSAGQYIAAVGDTGAADGCHLHFEVRINGSAINAVPFMSARGAPLG